MATNQVMSKLADMRFISIHYKTSTLTNLRIPILLHLSNTNDPLVIVFTVSPILRPGFDALNLSAPFIVQMNAEGKWENTRPANLDEERLKAVIQNLVNSNAISAAQSYCCQCAAENQFPKTQPQYIPVVMMPVYSADRCPFDMNCEVEKLREAEKGKIKKPSKKTKAEDDTKEEKDKDTIKRTKKRGFVMQRLTDFDLLSQW